LFAHERLEFGFLYFGEKAPYPTQRCVAMLRGFLDSGKSHECSRNRHRMSQWEIAIRHKVAELNLGKNDRQRLEVKAQIQSMHCDRNVP